VPGVARYRFVVERDEHRDSLRCEIELEDAADAEAVAETVRNRVRSALRFNAEVEVVASLDADAPAFVDTRTWE
jgi:phenylacetate-CoA ligase